MDFIGIDPGLKGGIARLSQQGRLIELESMPVSIQSKYNLFKTFNKEDKIYVEKVSSRPTDSRRGSFTFGKHIGELHTILSILGLPFVLVGPKDWQLFFQLKREPKESKYGYKKRLLERAKSHRETSDRGCSMDLCSGNRISEGNSAEGRRYSGRKNVKIKTFGGEQLTLNTCDAYLIALYAYQKSKQENQ